MHCRYAVLGVQLFTYVIRGDMLTEDRNFESFGNALLLLFQALTGNDPGPMARGLQPRVLEAAPLLCAMGLQPGVPWGCDSTCRRLQPYVSRRRLGRDDERVRRVARRHGVRGRAGRAAEQLRLALRGHPVLRLLPVPRIFRLPQPHRRGAQTCIAFPLHLHCFYAASPPHLR